MQLDGTVGKITNMGQDPLSSTGSVGQIENQLIVIVDDELRRTFVSTYQVQEKLAAPPNRWSGSRSPSGWPTAGRKWPAWGPSSA